MQHPGSNRSMDMKMACSQSVSVVNLREPRQLARAGRAAEHVRSERMREASGAHAGAGGSDATRPAMAEI